MFHASLPLRHSIVSAAALSADSKIIAQPQITIQSRVDGMSTASKLFHSIVARQNLQRPRPRYTLPASLPPSPWSHSWQAVPLAVHRYSVCDEMPLVQTQHASGGGARTASVARITIRSRDISGRTLSRGPIALSSGQTLADPYYQLSQKTFPQATAQFRNGTNLSY